jgi:hypothetical protein
MLPFAGGAEAAATKRIDLALECSTALPAGWRWRRCGGDTRVCVHGTLAAILGDTPTRRRTRRQDLLLVGLGRSTEGTLAANFSDTPTRRRTRRQDLPGLGRSAEAGRGRSQRSPRPLRRRGGEGQSPAVLILRAPTTPANGGGGVDSRLPCWLVLDLRVTRCPPSGDCPRCRPF